MPRAALVGDPVTVTDSVILDNRVVNGAVSVAATGLMAYRTGGAGGRQLTWIDPAGNARGTVGDPDATLMGPRVSPDGRRVVVARTVEGNQEIWLLDGARATRITFDAAADRYPVWSPDSAGIALYSNRTGVGQLYLKRANGASIEDRLLTSELPNVPYSWSADGRFLLYHSVDPQTTNDLWVMPMRGDRKPSVFLKTPFREVWAAFSPDGRWVAYQSNESGRPVISDRSSAPRGPRGGGGGGGGLAESQWQVSTAGGIHPVWRPDGTELHYLNPAGAMMAATISVVGPTFEPGVPRVLFPTRIYGGGLDTQQGRQYDVGPDGRFLINRELDSAAVPITLVMNWRPEAKDY